MIYSIITQEAADKCGAKRVPTEPISRRKERRRGGSNLCYLHSCGILEIFVCDLCWNFSEQKLILLLRSSGLIKRKLSTSAQDECQRIKREFDAVRQTFKVRLEEVRAMRKRRQGDTRSIAEKAGVPRQYLGDLRVSRD